MSSKYTFLQCIRTNLYRYAHFKITPLLGLTLSIVLFSVNICLAQDTLVWNPNSEEDLVGYIVYVGTSSGNYDFYEDVGNQTTYPLTDFMDGNDYYFVLTAYNTSGIESDFSNEVVYNPPLPTNGIIDNGDPGTSSKGIWLVSDDLNPYGLNSIFSNEIGAIYGFQASGVKDTYEVSMWWANDNSGCDSVPVDIYDGNTIIDTVYVNQLIDGGQWNVLSRYGFSGSAKVVITSQGSCKTSVDAVRFVANSNNQEPDGVIDMPSGSQTINIGDSVYFTGIGTDPDNNEPLTYLWDFGAGSGIPDSVVQVPGLVQFNTSGVFTVTFTVKDSLGLTDSTPATVTVTVNALNTPPVANAGTDQTALSGMFVSLDGSNSSDADGAILSYSWVQIEGPSVPLNTSDTPIASFYAPVISSDTILRFRLTVTDDQDVTASDETQVTIQPNGGGTDITPPITTLGKFRYKYKGRTHYEITLTTNESATSYFRITGKGSVVSGGTNSNDWQTYSGIVTIKLDKRGSVTLDYYSIDESNNQEVVKREVLNR